MSLFKKGALINHQRIEDNLAVVRKRFESWILESGSGIIHQIILESYAFPGGVMIGTD